MSHSKTTTAETIIQLLEEKGWEIKVNFAENHDNLAAFFLHTETQQTLMINAFSFAKGARAQIHLHGIAEQMEISGESFLTACLNGLSALMHISDMPRNIREALMLPGTHA